MSTPSDKDIVVIQKPNGLPVTVTGLAARWIWYIAEFEKFLNDPRNAGAIEFHFSGKEENLRAVTKVQPQP